MTDLIDPLFLLLAAAAMLVDALIGNSFLLRYLPGPDRLLYGIHTWAIAHLDREDRSDGRRQLRGLLVFLVTGGGAGLLGYLLDHVAAWPGGVGATIALLVLATLLGQRSVWDLALGIAKALEDPRHEKADARFGAARWAVERTALRFADGVMANLVFFLLGGFTALLVFRALSMMMAAGAPSGLKPAPTPYFRIIIPVFKLVTLVPAALSSLVLAVAALFVPGGHIAGLKGLTYRNPDHATLASRRRPLATMAFAFGLNFRVHPDERGETVWIGPEDGRARLSRADVRRPVLTALVASLILLLMLMILIALALV